MSRLVSIGNLFVFEYPKCDKPVFNLQDDGVLWIEGYSIPFTPNGKEIRAMKRFELGLKNHKVLGKYEDAKKIIVGDFETHLDKLDLDLNNCIFLADKTQVLTSSEN